MTLYKLDEWEHNGHDDSDWYAVVYNDETDALDRVTTGTTRFAEALHCGPAMLAPTPEVMVKAKAALARLLLASMQHVETVRVNEPGPEDIQKGARVRFLVDHSCMMKDAQKGVCPKCKGSKCWTNPRNSADQRPCFGCKGTGEVTTEYVKRKGADGKQEWHRIAAGATGEVRWSKAYGTFYRNGYNQPCRHNTTVLVVLDDGREVKAPLSKLRLDREIVDMAATATAAAEGGGFYGPFRTAGVRL